MILRPQREQYQIETSRQKSSGSGESPRMISAHRPCPDGAGATVFPRRVRAGTSRWLLETVFTESHLALDEVPAGADPPVPGVGASTAEQQEVTLKHTVLVLGVEGGHHDVLGHL